MLSLVSVIHAPISFIASHNFLSKTEFVRNECFHGTFNTQVAHKLDQNLGGLKAIKQCGHKYFSCTRILDHQHFTTTLFQTCYEQKKITVRSLGGISD